MKKIFVIPIFLKKLTIAKFLSHFVLSSVLLFLFLLLWLNSDDLNTLITPKTKSMQVNCDLQAPPHHCLIETTLGPLEITTSSEILSLVPFKIQLKTPVDALSSAKISREGFDDYMGSNKFRFSQDTIRSWTADGSIPICTTKSKTWKVIVSLYNGTNYQSYWFKMKTK